MIGHALIHAPRHAVHPVSERWVAAGFGIGSVCFLVGPFPGFVQLVGARADAWVFFIGSLFFTAAGGLELLHATVDRPKRDATWWSAAIQFAVNLAGCVFFMISAIASYVIPDTGSVLALAAANWNTALGAACFLAGSVMLARHQRGVTS